MFRNSVRLIGVALTAGALGACAQSSVVSKSELRPSVRQAHIDDNRDPAATGKPASVKTAKRTPFRPAKRPGDTEFASLGIASFYTEGQQTANGEKFDPGALTAAHRTLPFGTKVRVTNVATGRSVTVRINDRGPFVAGRVVDVSYSAAESLGIVGRGVAKVKLDVVP
jgi:rare lipoprotein A